ncbi:hypothetical protein BC832DRAFT_119472 [Gaertneriomyces semiglobifer]|nr:hypothetical protein BC832DRAFT_119472 [Gaertneriomyces semiglobifer]
MADQRGVYGGADGGDTGFRRKWDLEEYRKKAEDREKGLVDKDKKGKEKQKPKDQSDEPEPELLRARDTPIDLTSSLNKTQLVDPSQAPGFYCETCDCTLKDSVAYLDHINGRKHQQNLGMSMKVERSTVEQVRKRLEILKRKKEGTLVTETFDERLERRRREEREEKERKKNEKKERKRVKREEQNGTAPEDEDMMKLMGFAGFQTTKS